MRSAERSDFFGSERRPNNAFKCVWVWGLVGPKIFGFERTDGWLEDLVVGFPGGPSNAFKSR